MATKGEQLWNELRQTIAGTTTTPNQTTTGNAGVDAWNVLKDETGLGQKPNTATVSFDSFITGTKKLAEQIGMNDFRSATANYNALQDQRNVVGDYIAQNWTNMDSDTYSNWREFLDLFDEMGGSIQEHQDKLNFDFDANQAEVESLNRILSEYDFLSRTMTDERGTARLAEIESMYGNKAAIQAAITALETSANRARYYQQGYALGDVGDPSAAGYDPAFAQLSQYKPSNDTLSLYINDPAFRGEYQQTLWIAEVFGLNEWSAMMDYLGLNPYDDNYADLGYDKLTENETNLYNYYYNTGGKDAADRYLASIQETLNARAGYERSQELGDSALAKYAFAPEVGIDQFISGMRNLGDSVASHWGEGSEYIPTSSTQFAGAYTREDLADVGPQIFGSSLGQVVFDTGTTTFNMMPSILASVVSNTIAPGSGAYVGGALMGMSAAGGAYQEALNQGYTNEQARLYGYAIGASEFVTSEIISGISAVGGQVTNHVVANALSRVDSGVLRAIGKLGASFTSEGMEEGLQEGLTPMIQRAILHQDSSIDWNAVGYSSMLGAMTALILEGVPTVAGAVNLTITGRNLIDAGVTAQRLAELGRSLSESEATELAERMLANPEKYANDAYSMGRLFNEVGAHLGEQNLIDITNKLVNLGMDQEMARKNAEVMSYVIDGGELTESDIAVLEANDVLAQAVKEAVIDPNASWNVRTREYMNMLDALEGKPEQADVKGENQPPVKETKPTTAEVKEPVKVEEPSPEAVAEAQAIRISDKAPVEVQGVSAVRNGRVTLQLADGTQEEVGNINFKDENEARLYDTISQMGKNLTASAANTLIKSYNAVRSDETAAHNYVMGITEAFNYGKKGIPMRELSGTEYASTLNPGQQQYAWNRGQNVAGNQVAKDEASIRKLVKEAQEIIRSGKAAGSVREATVELTDGITEADLNDKQSQVYALANRIAPGMSLKVKVYSGKTTGWGYYDPKTDEVYLNLNASNKNRQTMMAHALGHELVHRAKLGSPAKYQAFTAFLMREYSKREVSVEDMIEEQMQAAKEAGFEMTPEEAYEEVVCDACQTMLLDTDAGKKLAMFGAQSEQNKSILDEIRDWINDFMEKIRAYFADVEPDSMAAREFKKFDDNVKQILADMYVDMSIDAGENLSVIMHAFGKNTLVETNADGEFTVASNEDGSKKLFNLTTWENGGRETLEATLIREGYSQDEVKAALTIMDEKQKMVMDIANELNDNGDLAFPEQGRINEATLTTDIKTGKSVMSALVTNGDYPINIDLLMVCKKRKAYQRVINRLCDTGMIEQATIDAMAIAQINKILGKYGFETACIGCFVESRRLRIQEWAETIVEEWNAEVKQRNPEAKPFGFGKGNAKLTQDEIIKLDYELRKGGKKNKQGNLNLGRGSAVTRMGRLLDKVPSLQKTLTVEDLITPDGLAALRAMDGNLFSMVKSRYGSNSPKFVQEFNPYNHEIAMYGKPPKGYKNLRDYLYAIGGARMQSFSDFIVENWFDYCQIVADLAARKLPMHTYTKEIALVKLFGMTGIKINMSLIPDIDRSMGREYAGLTRNANGELELIWADKDRNKATGGKSYMQSINFADAIALQNDPRYSANIGTIAIGVSDIQIRMMLADPRVRMVIPYHSSGMNPVFAKMMGSDFYRDYTDYQNTTVKQLYNSEGQPVSLNLEKKQTEKLTGGFLWNKVLQETGDARAAAEAYKDWCADKSKHTVKIDGKTYTAELTPKFDDFKDEANYYKLLTDFNPYDCITEEAAPQGDVRQIYPENFDKILKDELTAQEAHRQKQEKNQAFDKAMGEIEDYLKGHKTEKQLHEAGMKQKVPVNDSGEKRIADTQEVSTRTLLEKALETPDLHEVLQKRIKSYLENDNAFQKEEAKLLDIREEIRDLSLLNNKADAARIRELQSEALKTAHRMDTLEGRLRRAEADKYLSQILKDERAKLTADQKPQSKPRTNLQNARATELSEWLREQRAMRQELTGREADTALIEREFIRLVKEYEKQGNKDAARYDSLKSRMDKKVTEQKTDKQIWEREFKRLLREYDASGRKISRLEQRVEAQKNRAAEKVENRKKSDVRQKILNLKDRLRKSLLSPTERMYVPVNLVNAMIDVCNLINEDTDIYKKDGSINKAQQNRIRMREKLQQLREEYEQLRTTSDPMYKGEFDEQVYDYLGKLRNRFDGKNIRELSLGELNEMYEYLKGIEGTLTDSKKLIGWNDAKTVYQAADSVVAEQGAITAKRKGKDRSHAQKVQDANYNLTLSPMRNVERMSGYNQDSYLYQFFRRFEQGVRKKNLFIMNAHKAFNDFTGIKDYDKTLYDAVGGKKYEDENGRKFGVSKMQMMQAILSWERETANDMNHIQGLGITFADLDKIKNGKMKDAVSDEYSHRVPAPVAIEMISDFQKQLKDDKWAQGYMAEARKFFNDTAKNAINETTIALKHRIVAKDKNYIPFEADKSFVVNEISAENNIQETISSYGMLKDVKKGASQPIIVTGLNNVLERHIEKVANVYGLAIEVRNFNKVWNAKSDAAGVPRTVKGAVEKNWGAGGVKMITQAVQDIQGPRVKSDNALYKKIKSNYINATFLLNFSVVAKQIGSLFSSTSMLRWRGPVRMLFNLGSTMLHHKKIAAEVDKYTATAWVRKQGISDAELDNFMTEGKHSLVRRLYDKLPDAVHPEKYIAFMDYSVALSLWKYAKIDTQKRTKLKGEELLRETAKFYDDLVEQTQSMADVLHRPEAQKKEGVIAESFGLFKTDLYQMAGQLQNAAGRFGANKTKANAKAVTKTVTAIAGSALWAQLMTSMFALLRYKVNQYRDEEDKDLTVESWLKRQKFSIAADLIGYLFPLFGSELVGIFEKFAYGESDVLVDNLALTAINDLSDLAFEVAASIKDGEMPDTEDLLNLATKSLQLLGVPANNIMRSYNSLRLHGRDILNGKPFSFEAGIDRTPTEHIYRVMDAINDGDTAEAVELFEYAVEEGAKERAENGIFGTDEIKQSESALRDRVGEMYREGDISATMARTLLMECFDLDKDEVDLMLAKWDFKMEYDYSWSDKGDAYLNHDISARDLRELLIEIDGKTEEEADDYIKALDFEMEYGWDYDSRVTEYIKGNVTDSELRMALINYGGMSIEEADTYMKAYRWIKNNPEYDLTVNRVLTYTAPVKNLGISIEQAGIDANVFNDYADLRAECEGIDANGDGKADSGTVKDQVIPIIDSLPLTPEQKDVLYIQNGWAQSGLRKTPWH